MLSEYMAGDRRLENGPSRDAAADFQACYPPILDSFYSSEQAPHFVAKLEIGQPDLRPRTFVLVELHVYKHRGRGRKCGFSIDYV